MYRSLLKLSTLLNNRLFVYNNNYRRFHAVLYKPVNLQLKKVSNDRGYTNFGHKPHKESIHRRIFAVVLMCLFFGSLISVDEIKEYFSVFTRASTLKIPPDAVIEQSETEVEKGKKKEKEKIGFRDRKVDD